MLDFRPAASGIGVNQKSNAAWQRSGNRNLGGMQEGDDIPAELLGGSGGKGGVEVPGDRKQRADDIVGLESVCVDQGAQQLVCGRQDLTGLVPADGGGSPNAVKPSWSAHGS